MADVKCLKPRPVLNFSLNLLLTLLLVAVTLALKKGLLLSPVRNGFFCGDQSIGYPVKEESVNTNLLIAIGSLAVFAVALSAELLHPKRRRREKTNKDPNPNFFKRLPDWLRGPLRSFFLFLVGFATNVLLFELGKYKTGVLRPNFLAACAPNVTCVGSEYVEDFACTAATEKEEEDARKSFPSGHAAVVSYMALFLCLFLQRRPWALSGQVLLLRPAVQVSCAAVAWMTSLTRVSDHVHHVSDVVVGIVLGCAVAVWAEGLSSQAEMQSNNEGNYRRGSGEEEVDPTVVYLKDDVQRKGEEGSARANGVKTQL